MADVIFQSYPTRPGARLIFIGDIHGCFDELTELLARVAPGASDVVVSVGDIVTKGPAAAKCLDLWRERGYLAVRGNNEIKVLERARPLLRLFIRENADVLRRKDLLRYIESWPLVIDFPDAAVTAVHGGFLPQMEITQQDVEAEQEIVSHLRWIRRKNGGWKAVPRQKRKKDDVLWAEKWKGDRFVVYGHTPLRTPKFDKRALGLDTGCVYGGSLSAGVFANGEWTTVSVAAKRKYAE
ncbi:MAG TPA: metallophosphoesterase family protein [Thermoanaerobaculia bacterium]|nr:metallophosphoesterase family protein [Thermoanaerobaculia bacterium]